MVVDRRGAAAETRRHRNSTYTWAHTQLHRPKETHNRRIPPQAQTRQDMNTGTGTNYMMEVEQRNEYLDCTRPYKHRTPPENKPGADQHERHRT
eukprot:9358288-Prorocentrum_lima.AAC.1